MASRADTIRNMVRYLNNADEDGGYWLPNIQRPFVWTEEQICRLFDSILREYPIGTLLIWKTKSTTRHRKFIDNWKDTLRLSDFNVPENEKRKRLVLDGQQRLQSLFIGLCGSYESKELYFDILSGETCAPDDIKYRFKFLSPSAGSFPWVKFKDLIFTTKKPHELRASLADAAGRPLTTAEIDKIDYHLYLTHATFKSDSTVVFQELDSIDNPTLYSEDDVVEIFIRANAGGTRLGKSDLLFSLLNASWDEADEKMEILLESLNRHGFDFNRDFVLKTCLVLLGQGARYEVPKFRKPGVRQEINNKWEKIAGSIQAVVDFVRSKTFIQCDKALPTHLVLIPLVYLHYHFPDAWERAERLDSYLLRSSLAGAFSGVPDNLIDALVKNFQTLKQFSVDEVFGVIRSQGRSLELTEDRLWQMGYGSDTIHLLFNIWYSFNYTPSYQNNLPQIDHIFPQSALKEVKMLNPDTGRSLMRYREAERNQLANCMLLTMKENGAGGKGATLPEEWFDRKIAEEGMPYLDKHLIPHDRSLWQLDRFEDFIKARQDLIRQRFESILV